LPTVARDFPSASRPGTFRNPDPEILVPGSKMFFSVDKAGDRADIIAFLKERAK